MGFPTLGFVGFFLTQYLIKSCVTLGQCGREGCLAGGCVQRRILGGCFAAARSVHRLPQLMPASPDPSERSMSLKSKGYGFFPTKRSHLHSS